jgi:hypothetical protein
LTSLISIKLHTNKSSISRSKAIGPASQQSAARQLSALEDLAEGTAFYENKQACVGAYFLESLYSDIESLKLYAGIHRKVFGSHFL